MTALPTGTVTFLFTEIEGSTRLLETQPAAYRAALAHHDTILERAIADHGGIVFERAGDSFAAAFMSPAEAVHAALAGQQALNQEVWSESVPLRVRVGLHTGEVEIRGEQYFGLTLHRCARLMSSAHGGQIVLSTVTAGLVRESLPPGVSLVDLGAHHLRDLTHPEHLYQLVGPGIPTQFPPVRTLTATTHNLPRQATTFVGREQQLQAVRAALLRPSTRLLTLTGPGGTGKTRLSLQVAADVLESFPGGVFFVPLASITDPDLVPSAIAQVLDVRETVGRSLVASLVDLLAERQILLILDNFEQIVDAAPLVAELLAAPSPLKILVTSRAILRLYGEQEYPVPPLALPDRRSAPSAAHLSHFEAVRLFVSRAQAARPDFALVDQNAADIAEICHRLDGLPLAIELAAARIRALPPSALLQRMERRLPLLTGGARNLPARQRTLRDAIGWSYDLLEPGEQALFRRLAVFRGCTLEAAETVCAGELPRPGATTIALPPLDLEVLDGIESLVEKSLLRQQEGVDGQPRYSMLETVREYALERLEESGEDGAVQRRHALAALELAETAAPELHEAEQAIWFARVEQEHDNLRAALGWCAAQGYTEPALRLAVALWNFWSAHGHVDEGRGRLAGLLERFPMRPARAALHARVLYAAATLASIQGDFVAARALHEEGLTLRRDLDDRHGVFSVLESLATAACLQGDHVVARAYMEEALSIAREFGLPRMIATAYLGLSNIAAELGDLPGARAYCEESVELARQAADPRQLGFAVLQLASIVQEEGDFNRADELATEAVSLWRREADPRSVSLALANLGSIALARGQLSTAQHHLRECLAIQNELGDTAGVTQILERLLGLVVALDQPAGALRLASAAGALRERAGSPQWSRGKARLEQTIAPARRLLGEEAAAEAWQAGLSLTVEQIVAEALAITDLPVPAARSAPPAADPAASTGAVSVLTPREQEVAALIGRGLTNRQIAETLVITEGTAANHVVHILSKLGYSSRAQVAVWAAEHGLLADRPET